MHLRLLLIEMMLGNMGWVANFIESVAIRWQSVANSHNSVAISGLRAHFLVIKHFTYFRKDGNRIFAPNFTISTHLYLLPMYMRVAFNGCVFHTLGICAHITNIYGHFPKTHVSIDFENVASHLPNSFVFQQSVKWTSHAFPLSYLVDFHTNDRNCESNNRSHRINNHICKWCCTVWYKWLMKFICPRINRCQNPSKKRSFCIKSKIK